MGKRSKSHRGGSSPIRRVVDAYGFPSPRTISPASQWKSTTKKATEIVEEVDPPFLVVKLNEGGPTNLHPILEQADWHRLLEATKVLRRSKTFKDIRKAYTAINENGETALHVAAYKAPPKLAVKMLDLIPVDCRKEYLLKTDNDGNTPLHLACSVLDEHVDFCVIKNLLLLAPEALDRKNDMGDSPLHFLVSSPGFRRSTDFSVEIAAEEAISSLLMMLPNGGCDQNRTGVTLLHAAIAHGAHERVLVKLLGQSPEQAKITDIDGMLPVHYCAAFGGTPWTFVGRLIWAYPEGISQQTDNGDTPLHLLVSNARKHLKDDQFLDRNTTKLAELLVGSGNELDSPMMIQNDERLCPLHCCSLFQTPPQLTRVLMESRVAEQASMLKTELGATPLHLACASSTISDELATIETLATTGACTVWDDTDRTPLMVAVQNKHVSRSIVKILCKANPIAASWAGKKGFLPLHLALQTSKVKDSVVKELVKASRMSVEVATVTSRNTALHEACQYGASASVVAILIEKNRKALKATNKGGETPLDVAIRFGASRDVIKLLKDKSKDRVPLRTASNEFSGSFHKLMSV